MPPAFERREHHKEIGRAVALVFVIEPGRPPRFHLDRSARFGDQLLRGFVQANQRHIGIAWPRVHGQHVFHGRYESAIGLRRDNPLLFQMRLENVFLRVRPMVLSLARSTMFSSTTLFSNNRNVQRARPLGGSEQARAISSASFSPSKSLGTAGAARGLRLNAASRPSSTSCLRTRWTIDALVSNASMISLSLHPWPASETSAFNKIRAFSRRWAGPLPFRICFASCSRSRSLNGTTYF